MKLIRVILVVVITGILASCSSVKVVADMDQTVDFSKYSTYSFLGWQDNSDQILNEFDKKRLRDAFVKEFEARDLKYVEEGGDMDITLFVVVDQKTTTTAYTNYYGGAYGGYYRYRAGWGYGHATTTYSESDYLQGTLVMDVFDGSSKKQIWQGIATSTVTENPDKREKTIPAKISALMKKFPVQPE
jgi:hypothetical protein